MSSKWRKNKLKMASWLAKRQQTSDRISRKHDATWLFLYRY